MRIESLTFFRFLAAIVVVFFHFGRNTELAKIAHPIILSGPQMVTFFFVLSGFVMMISHYHKNETLRNYYVARFARIFPIYIVALMIMAYFVYGYGNNNMTGLLLSATFLQSWFPPYPLSFNDPGWSLSVEALFYLSFPLILFVIKKSNINATKFAIIALLSYFFTLFLLANLMTSDFNRGYQTASFDLIYYFPLSHLCGFLLGVAGGYIYVKNQARFNQSGKLPMILLLAAMFLSYFLLQYPFYLRRISGFALNDVPSFYSIFFVLLILSVAYANNIVTKVLSLPVLVLLGEASYALYILQKPVHMAYKLYISEYLDLSSGGHFYVYLALLVFISILALYIIEKPSKKLIFKLNDFISQRTQLKKENTEGIKEKI